MIIQKNYQKPNENRDLGKQILWRVLSMLINEAVDTLPKYCIKRRY